MTERALQSDAEFFKQRGFGLKIGFGERPALLVIDMLKAFTNPQMMLGANLDKEIEAIKPLLAVAHERDIPVIFSTVIYSDADLKDAGIWALKQKGVVTLKGGSEGVKIDPRLDFRKTDSLLVKKYASCFFGTDLVSRLWSRRVDTLIIVGCATSGCVRATAVDAVQTGLRPMVVREAVGDRRTRGGLGHPEYRALSVRPAVHVGHRGDRKPGPRRAQLFLARLRRACRHLADDGGDGEARRQRYRGAELRRVSALSSHHRGRQAAGMGMDGPRQQQFHADQPAVRGRGKRADQERRRHHQGEYRGAAARVAESRAERIPPHARHSG